MHARGQHCGVRAPLGAIHGERAQRESEVDARHAYSKHKSVFTVLEPEEEARFDCTRLHSELQTRHGATTGARRKGPLIGFEPFHGTRSEPLCGFLLGPLDVAQCS